VRAEGNHRAAHAQRLVGNSPGLIEMFKYQYRKLYRQPVIAESEGQATFTPNCQGGFGRDQQLENQAIYMKTKM